MTDAKIALSEARTDVKFARLEGKIEQVLTSMDGLKADFGTNRGLIIGVGLSLAGIIMALTALLTPVVGFSGTVSRGMSVRDVVKAVIAEQQPQTPAEP